MFIWFLVIGAVGYCFVYVYYLKLKLKRRKKCIYKGDGYEIKMGRFY
jgi:hypothetical protein